MALTIRKADMADLDAVLAVGHRTWPVTYEGIAGADYVQAGLAKWWSAEATSPAIRQGRLTVAEVDGAVVGMASVGREEDPLVLWRLYVLPEHHGQGIGSRPAGGRAGRRPTASYPRSGCPTPRATPRPRTSTAPGVSSRPTTRRAGAECPTRCG